MVWFAGGKGGNKPPGAPARHRSRSQTGHDWPRAAGTRGALRARPQPCSVQGTVTAAARHSSASSPSVPRGRGGGVLLTRAGGVGLVLVVPAVIVPIAEPAVGDAAVVLALEAVRGARVLVCGGDTRSGPALPQPTPSHPAAGGEKRAGSLRQTGIQGPNHPFPPQPLEPTPLLELGRRHRGPGCPTPSQPPAPHLAEAEPESCRPWSTQTAVLPCRRWLRTAELRGFVAVVQAVVVPVALPALLDAAVVLAGELPGLALRRGDVGRVGWQGKSRGRGWF